MYRKMVNLLVAEELRGKWAEAHGFAEWASARQLCARLKGRSRRQVIELLGQPAFKDGSTLCEKAVSRKESNWLYFFGGVPFLVRPKFVDGICISSSSETGDQDGLYNRWRAASLRRFAIGKQVADIICEYGEPYNDKYFQSSGKNHWREAAFPAFLLQHPKYLENLDAADDILYYQFGNTETELAFIRKGRCFFVDNSPLALGGLGFMRWEHQPYWVPFRMPPQQR